MQNEEQLTRKETQELKHFTQLAASNAGNETRNNKLHDKFRKFLHDSITEPSPGRGTLETCAEHVLRRRVTGGLGAGAVLAVQKERVERQVRLCMISASDAKCRLLDVAALRHKDDHAIGENETQKRKQKTHNKK